MSPLLKMRLLIFPQAFFCLKKIIEKRIDTAWLGLQRPRFFAIIILKDRRLSGLTTGSETLHPQGAYKPPKVALG